MFKKLGLILGAVLLLGAGPALALPSNVVPGSYALPGQNGCPASSILPCFYPSASIAVAGTQVGVSIASATALTVPSGATYAVIQAQGTNNTTSQCLFWRDDGTNPTTSAGIAMANGDTYVYSVAALPIKLIQASGATCTFTAAYYK